MTSAIRDRRAAISTSAIGRSAASSLTYSIEVRGRFRDSSDIYTKAQDLVFQWRSDVFRRGLPFHRSEIF
jgi:hypothetical protein